MNKLFKILIFFVFIGNIISCGPRRYGCGPRRCEVKPIEKPVLVNENNYEKKAVS